MPDYHRSQPATGPTLMHYLVDAVSPRDLTPLDPVEDADQIAERKETLRTIRAMSYAQRRTGARRLCNMLLGELRFSCSTLVRMLRGPSRVDRVLSLELIWGQLMTTWQAARTIDWLDRRYELGLGTDREKK